MPIGQQNVYPPQNNPGFPPLPQSGVQMGFQVPQTQGGYPGPIHQHVNQQMPQQGFQQIYPNIGSNILNFQQPQMNYMYSENNMQNTPYPSTNPEMAQHGSYFEAQNSTTSKVQNEQTPHRGATQKATAIKGLAAVMLKRVRMILALNILLNVCFFEYQSVHTININK